MPCNLVSGKPYRGINIFLLGMQGRASKYWLTFKQANQLGGHVRTGEKASTVTFWNVGEERFNAKTGKMSKPFLLRYYSVFNATQIDGLEKLKKELSKRVRKFRAVEKASLADSAAIASL